MAGEGAQFAVVLERIGREVIAALNGVPDALLNQPLPFADANTLFALGTHLVGAGEFWVLALVGGRAIERNRLAEFHATGHGPDLIARYERWLVALHEVLDNLPDTAMSRPASPPAEYRNTGGMADQQLYVRDCLLHAVEHSALHLGHVQITRQLILAHAGEGA